MTSFIAKQASKRVFKETAENKFGKQDPYFEYTEFVDRKGKTQVKKGRRALPPNLTKPEEEILAKVIRRAHRLDTAINLVVFRLGWGVIFGLIPVIGDFIDTFLAFMIYKTCLSISKAGPEAALPPNLQHKMLMNVTLGCIIGLVPGIGDIADGIFKCNTRNAWILYAHLQKLSDRRANEKRGGGGGGSRRNSLRRNSLRGSQANGAVAAKQQQQHRGEARVNGSLSRENGRTRNGGRQNGEYHGAATQDPLAAPEPVRLEKGRSSRGGFLSRFTGSRDEETDLERA